MFLARHLSVKLLDLRTQFPVIVLSGARQVGKTTLLRHALPSSTRWVTLDPVIDVQNARREPDLFLDHHGTPLVLDEIQYAPELSAAIKRRIDRDRRPGQYFLTGSQKWSVMRSLSDSLAGRAVFLDLEGFSLAESAEASPGTSWVARWLSRPGELGGFGRLRTRFPLYEQLWRGFLPEAQLLPRSAVLPLLEGYERTYLERDVRSLADFDDFQAFGRFFRLLAAFTAQEINHSHLGRELGVTPQTARRWLGVLQATFQWIEVPAFSRNAVRKVSLKPKGYLSDTGLACHAQAVSSPEALPGHPLLGALFETAVVAEIRKQLRLLPFAVSLSHWRSHAGGEVDLVLEKDGTCYPIEIKTASHPGTRAASGLNAFRKAHPTLKIAPGLVVCPAEAAYPLQADVSVLPWDASAPPA
jgi:hypothetical protein